MKSLVLVLSFLVAGSAFANDFEAMSWNEILDSNFYDVDRSNKIHFQDAAVWVFAMDKKLCTDGTFIYGGTVEKTWTSEGNQVIDTKKVDLVQPIVSERQVCVLPTEGNCAKYQTVVYRQSPNRVINILDGYNGKNQKVLGNKSYSIPACGSLSPIDAN